MTSAALPLLRCHSLRMSGLKRMRILFWLCCRGYNTDIERRKAQDMDGVRLLSLPDFCELLRWGIIMGVSPATQSYSSGLAGK